MRTQNKDGFVSTAEKDAFDKDLFKGKGVTLIAGQPPRDINGYEVPKRTLTEWVIKYRPSK